MSNLPWMFQTHIADAKAKQLEAALQTIADRETDLAKHSWRFEKS